MTDKNEIPTYTKVGYRVTVILLLIIGGVMLKNCVSSINYGRKTQKIEIQLFYEKGFTAGAQKAHGNIAGEIDFDHENPLLKKMYLKGFREGWDSVKMEKP